MSVTPARCRRRESVRESTGPRTTTRSASSTRTAESWRGSSSTTTPLGCKTLVRRLLRAGVEEVGIERSDGPVVEALFEAELTVLVIAPGQLKNLRSRYGSAGNKDDRFDAYVLADVVRTDRRRLRPLVRDSAATTAMRTTVRARRDLVEHRVAAANQLRAHLQLVFPGAASLFADIDSAISLSFLDRFPTQTHADWLSPKRLGTWLRSVSYSGRTDPEVLHTRLLAAPRGTTGPDAEIHAVTTPRLRRAPARPEHPDRRTRGQPRRATHHPPRHPHLRIPAPGREPCAPPDCSPRSATPAASSPPPTRWPPWPVSHPRPGSPARSKPSPSGGDATNNSATPSATSPATPDTTTPGPPTSTTAPSPADTTTPTPSASSAAPGHTSSGAAGKTTSPTTPAKHRALQTFSTTPPSKPPKRPGVDTGQLMRSPSHSGAR